MAKRNPNSSDNLPNVNPNIAELPPPSIYSIQNEYANPTAPSDNPEYVPTDDVFLAVPQSTINSIYQVAENPVPYAIVKDYQAPLLPQGLPFICPPNYVNFNGQCIPAGSLVNNVPILTECQSTGDCPSGFICVNGTCVSADEANSASSSKSKTPTSESSDFIIFGVIAAIVVIIALVFIFRKR